MSSAPTTESLPHQPHQPHQPSYLAAFLSYLVPGLGQIAQGRFGKGLLFMVSLLGMFHLGQAMGNWQNVYVPRAERGGLVAGLFNRWHYGGQFWIGVAAWPALWQHFDMPLPKTGGDLGAATTLENAALKVQAIAPNSPAETAGLKTGDTIINIDDVKLASVAELDAFLKAKLPGMRITVNVQREKQTIPLPVVLGQPAETFWQNFQKMPDEGRVNRFLVNADKSPDLGWVYTVIAGMLNILVIYDAFAGAALPMVRPTNKPQTAVAAQATAGGPA